MTVEIERKFVLSEVPNPARLGEGEHLRQGYIADNGDVTVRIRIADSGAWLTVKAGSGLTRTEVELPLLLGQAEALWPRTEGRRVSKTRHRITLGQREAPVAEVDVYDGDLVGLYTVEVEFSTEQAALNFVPPAWFGREVTGQNEWTNAALARHGRPANS